jgi:hypothetical protein
LSRYTPKKKSQHVLEKTLVFLNHYNFASDISHRFLPWTSHQRNEGWRQTPSLRKKIWSPSLTGNCPSVEAGPGSLFNRLRSQRKASLLSRFCPILHLPSTGRPTWSHKVHTPTRLYDYGARYGGFRPTRFDSSMVNDDEADARAEWQYNPHRYAAQTAGYAGSYSAPYSDPSAQSRGFCAPYVDSQRES